MSERSDRAWLEAQVRDLEAANEGLQASNRQLSARVHLLRGEIDRLGRIVRLGGVVRGTLRDPRRLRLLRLDIAQAIQRRPVAEPSEGGRLPEPAAVAAVRRAETLAAVEWRRRRAAPARRVEDLRLGLVADPPLHHLLAGVCTVVPLRADDAAAAIVSAGLDLVLVESAWAGAGGSWRYRIAWHPHQRSLAQDDLGRLVAAADAAGVPTVFWLTAARHDAARFAGAARRFGLLFASDEGALERLATDRERRWVSAELLHPGVRVDLHHPADPPGGRGPLFIGSLPLALPIARREAIEGLLRAALPHAPLVADRQAGGDPSRFDRLGVVPGAPAIRPAVASIPGLYRQHPVVLLPSMAATGATVPARLFEALASGAPVVTTRSDGAVAVAGDLAVATDDPAAIGSAISEAIAGGEVRDRVRAAAGALARDHDIRRRLAAIAHAAGIDVVEPAEAVDVLVLADDPSTFSALADDLAAEDAAVRSIVVGTAAWEEARTGLAGALSAALSGHAVRIVAQDRDDTPAERHRRLATVADGARVAIIGAAPRLPGTAADGRARAAAGGLAGLLGCAAASSASVVGLPSAGLAVAHTAGAALEPLPALVDRDLVAARGWPQTAAALADWTRLGGTAHAAAPATGPGARS